MTLKGNGGAGGAVKAEFGQDGEFFRRLYALGNDCQTDIVGDAAQAFEESLVAGLCVDGANETAVDLEVIDPDVVQAADLAELATKMLDTQTAAQRAQALGKIEEGIEMLEGTDFGDFHPQTRGEVGAGGDERLYAAAEIFVKNRFAREVDRNRRDVVSQSIQGHAYGCQIQFTGHREAAGHRHEAPGSKPFTVFGGLQAQWTFQVEQGAAVAGNREFDQAQAMGVDGEFE